jgi:hypothetical protein
MTAQHAANLIRTATDAAYDAAKELTKASVLNVDGSSYRDECLDAAEAHLRAALASITSLNRTPPSGVNVHPIFGQILADFGVAA